MPTSTLNIFTSSDLSEAEVKEKAKPAPVKKGMDVSDII